MVQRCDAPAGRSPTIGGHCQHESGQQRRECMVEYFILLCRSGPAIHTGHVGHAGLFRGPSSIDIGGLVHGGAGGKTAPK